MERPTRTGLEKNFTVSSPAIEAPRAAFLWPVTSYPTGRRLEISRWVVSVYKRKEDSPQSESA